MENEYTFDESPGSEENSNVSQYFDCSSEYIRSARSELGLVVKTSLACDEDKFIKIDLPAGRKWLDTKHDVAGRSRFNRRLSSQLTVIRSSRYQFQAALNLKIGYLERLSEKSQLDASCLLDKYEFERDCTSLEACLTILNDSLVWLGGYRSSDFTKRRFISIDLVEDKFRFVRLLTQSYSHLI